MVIDLKMFIDSTDVCTLVQEQNKNLYLLFNVSLYAVLSLDTRNVFKFKLSYFRIQADYVCFYVEF